MAWNYGGREDYEDSKFQTTTPGWAEACAYEWVARIVRNSTESNPDVGERAPAKTYKTVTLDDVQKLWRKSDPHAVTEAHLPSAIPLDYVEAVYIKQECDGGEELAKKFRDRGIPNVFVVEDPRDAVFDLFSKTPFKHMYADTEICQGYSFCVEPGLAEQQVPADISIPQIFAVPSKKREITFTVINGNPNTQDLFVTIANAPLGADKRSCFTFRLPPFSLEADGYKVPPAETKASKSEGKEAAILEGTTKASHHMFKLEIVPNDSATLTCLDTNKSVSIKTKKPMSCLTFSAAVYTCSVWDLEIKEK